MDTLLIKLDRPVKFNRGNNNKERNSWQGKPEDINGQLFPVPNLYQFTDMCSTACTMSGGNKFSRRLD